MSRGKFSSHHCAALLLTRGRQPAQAVKICFLGQDRPFAAAIVPRNFCYFISGSSSFES